MNNKKNIIALSIIGVIGIIGLTFAYFSSSSNIDNEFNTGEYGTTITEKFVSPENWIPGATEEKHIYVTNTGKVPVAVRISYTESWTSQNGDSLDLTFPYKSQNINAAIINFGDSFSENWVKSTEDGVDYYYYNTILQSERRTTDFIKSITYNEKVTATTNCTQTNIYDDTTGDLTGINSSCQSGDGYDGATYNLTLKIETIQSSVYKVVWDTDYEIGSDVVTPDPANGIINLLDKAKNPEDAEYNEETKNKMFVFSHEATSQIQAETDYRYIGDNPYNYVYFNCIDESNTSTCELWRIIGVFNVEREVDDEENPGNKKTIKEQRIKIVRNNSFSNTMNWNSKNTNDWANENASLKNFLNEDYYNKTGDASEYGLNLSARNMIEDAKFYLGGISFNATTHYGSAEQLYINERGTTVNGTNNTSWIGKIGLMYPSDEYLTYGKGVDNNCFNDPSLCYKNATPSASPLTSWIFNSNNPQSSLWFITHTSNSNNLALYVESTGQITNTYVSLGAAIGAKQAGVRPVVYLKSSVKIDGGYGDIEEPYILTY